MTFWIKTLATLATISALAGLAACVQEPQVASSDIVLIDDYWYDDDFWIWLDDDDDCCPDGDDLRDRIDDWWNGLSEDQQAVVKERVEAWLDDHNFPAEFRGPGGYALLRDTVVERWDALTPEERQSWVAGRQDRMAARRAALAPLAIEQQARFDALKEARADAGPIDRERLAEYGHRNPAAVPGIANHPRPGGSFGGRGGFGGGGRGGGGRR